MSFSDLLSSFYCTGVMLLKAVDVVHSKASLELFLYESCCLYFIPELFFSKCILQMGTESYSVGHVLVGSEVDVNQNFLKNFTYYGNYLILYLILLSLFHHFSHRGPRHEGCTI